MALLYGTAPAVGTDRFTRNRRTGIGGSDAAAIEGVSPWASALSLWEEKRGVAPPRSEPNEVMLWGTRLEHAIRSGYRQDTGIPVKKPEDMLRHPDIPWLIGHLDGWVEDRNHPKARLLEVKTAQRLSEQWGAPGSADIPLPYFVQVQHYMALTGYDLTDVAVLVSGREMHIYTVPADRSYIDALLADEAEFWRRVQENDPPAPDGSDSAGAVLRRMYPTATVDTAPSSPVMEVTVDLYLASKRVKEEAERDMAAKAQQMQSYMGSAGRMVVPGAVVTWANRAGSTSWKDVAADYRGMLDTLGYDAGALDRMAELRRGAPTRVFTVTEKAARS